MLFKLLKAGCLAIYALAVASLFGLLPPALTGVLQLVAAALLAIHALEMLFVWKLLHRAPGPFWGSVLQALLFGFVHWMPLNKLPAPAAN